MLFPLDLLVVIDVAAVTCQSAETKGYIRWPHNRVRRLVLAVNRPPSTWSLVFKEASLSLFTWWKHQKGWSRSSEISWGQSSEIARYFCCTLLFEASYKVSADSGEGEIDSANDRRCKEFVAISTVPQIPRNKSNKVCTRPLHRKQLNITERNFKRAKQVKGCTMLIHWKIEYYKVVISSQIDL